MNKKKIDKNRTSDGQSGPDLEQRLIAEFLTERKLTLADLKALPEDEARKLRIEASKYATARLAELEARSRFIRTIHVATRDVTD